MVFSSPVFLFLFLPLVLLLTFLFKGRTVQNAVLLVASLLFYAWGENELVLLMIFSIIVNYYVGLQIDRSYTDKKKNQVLTIGVAINLLLLLFYKYANFICDNINVVLEGAELSRIDLKPIHLPIGISFFTFQSLSYLIDVRKKISPAQKNPIDLALYISLFPQLIAGPIVRYHDIAKQLVERETSTRHFAAGARRFVMGLGKKVLIANPLGFCADNIFALPADELNFSISWIGIISYTLQIYYDFSGYSDMAIGLGKMFGFDFLENFNYPYISTSIKEFWRRWHISLSNWFRDYLYIPLGGNRVNSQRMYTNLFIVFFLTGLWHGAAWNFIVWGLFHGSFLVLERVGLEKVLKKTWRPLQHLYTLLVVMIGWVFFRAESFEHGFAFIQNMFIPEHISTATQYPIKYLNNELPLVMLTGILFCAPIYNWLKLRLYSFSKSTGSRSSYMRIGFFNTGSVIFYFLIMLLSAMALASNVYNPFIYFRF